MNKTELIKTLVITAFVYSHLDLIEDGGSIATCHC